VLHLRLLDPALRHMAQTSLDALGNLLEAIVLSAALKHLARVGQAAFDSALLDPVDEFVARARCRPWSGYDGL
jgi:hypothetical protein